MAVVLMADKFGEQDLSKGVEITTCARKFVFHPFEIRADLTPAQQRRVIQAAQKTIANGEILPLVEYASAKHAGQLRQHLERQALAVEDLEAQALLRKVSRPDILESNAEGLAMIAVALRRFPTEEVALRISRPALEEICLVGLGFEPRATNASAKPPELESPPAPAAELPPVPPPPPVPVDPLDVLSSPPTKEELLALGEHDLLRLLKHTGRVQKNATAKSLGGLETMQAFAIKQILGG